MIAITIQRRIEWMDTDAAGIWHYSTAIRFAEAAETELHRQLGIIDHTFGHTPRAHVEFDFSRTARFDDVIEITLGVSGVGTTSLTYSVTMTCQGDPVASGRVVTVFIDEGGKPTPWPAQVREALSG
ncbi:MAG TPA: thioesterase family protein [Acidimicrobiia bacterium]|nr:thioesterase family protein [Acidimicrobiia bacterium]